MFTIYNMHGPTVYQHKFLDESLQCLWNLRHSNGGVYRVLDDNGKEYARIDTFATYEPLCYAANQKLWGKDELKRQAA